METITIILSIIVALLLIERISWQYFQKPELEDRLWKIENPPKYKVGEQYDAWPNKEKKVICFSVDFDKEYYYGLGRFSRNWQYTFMDMQTKEIRKVYGQL